MNYTHKYGHEKKFQKLKKCLFYGTFSSSIGGGEAIVLFVTDNVVYRYKVV